jgi:hypothetical protein
MLYAMLHPPCTRPILGLSRVPSAKSIALHFALLVSFLAKSVRSSSAVVMLLSRNRSSLSCSYHCLPDVLSPCYLALSAVFFWVKHDDSVVCFA